MCLNYISNIKFEKVQIISRLFVFNLKLLLSLLPSVILQTASDDSLSLPPLLPGGRGGGGVGDQPLQGAHPMPLVLELSHGTQQLLPQFYQLVLQLFHLLVLGADPVDEINLLRVEPHSQLVDVLQVGDDTVSGDSVRFQVACQDVNFACETGNLAGKL